MKNTDGFCYAKGSTLFCYYTTQKGTAKEPTAQSLLQQYRSESEVLEMINTDDKTFLPAVVKFQDREKMTFMHSSTLSFGKTLYLEQ